MAKTRRRKKRTHVEEVPDPAKKKEPKTFVIRRGKLSSALADLEMDLRRMMLPNTALNLKETRRNVIKDFVQVAGPLGVSHFLILSATDASNYLRIAKTPRGPTMTLRIRGWSLARDVQSAQTHPRVPPGAFKTAPLVVLNGFTGHEHLKLATVLLQGMFPAINIRTARLSACQRVVLLARDKETGLISLRHFTISVAPSGLRKSLKGLLTKREAPDLGKCADVADFVTKSGYASESEDEDAKSSRVTLGQDLGRGNAAGHTSRVRLHEVGPRLELELVKVEEGMCEGRVLYHAHVAKTAEEAAALQASHEQRAQLKESRRRQQEENVKRKQALKKAKEEAAQAKAASGKAGVGQKRRREEDADGDGEADNDVEYFAQEVGHAPEKEDMVSAQARPSRGGGGGGGRRGRGRGRSDGRAGGFGRGRGGGGGGRGGGGRGQGGGRGRGSSFGGRGGGGGGRGFGGRGGGGGGGGGRGRPNKQARRS